MARKSLLTEAEIRQFMKLANIQPLQEMGHDMPGMRDDEEDEPGMRDMREADRDDEDEDPPGMRDMREADRDDKDEDPPGMRDMREGEDEDEDPPGMRDMREVEGPGDLDEELPVEEAEEEMGAEMEMDEPAADMEMDMDADAGMDAMAGKEEQFADIVDKLADLLGLDADVEVGGDEEAGGDAMDDKGGDLDAPMDAPEAPEMEMGDEDEADEPMMESDEDIVQEVARRVAARLLREKKQEDVANKLAERIFKRLASK